MRCLLLALLFGSQSEMCNRELDHKIDLVSEKLTYAHYTTMQHVNSAFTHHLNVVLRSRLEQLKSLESGLQKFRGTLSELMLLLEWIDSLIIDDVDAIVNRAHDDKPKSCWGKLRWFKLLS